MSKLSIEKLNKYKKEKGYTNRKISDITNTPIATVDRLFSGANSNPNIKLLQKIAQLFECTVDDFIEYDKTSIAYKYYENKETNKLVYKLLSNEEYKSILMLIKNLKSDDLNYLRKFIDIINQIKQIN